MNNVHKILYGLEWGYVKNDDHNGDSETNSTAQTIIIAASMGTLTSPNMDDIYLANTEIQTFLIADKFIGINSFVPQILPYLRIA